MGIGTLEEKIAHARAVEEALPEITDNFISLLEKSEGNTDSFLTYIDADENRVEFTYHDFQDLVKRVAAFYQSQGLQPGDRIATISHNHWHTVVQYFAAWACGMVVVPVNLGEDDNRITYILENANVKMVLVRGDYTSRIKGLLDGESGLSEIQMVECSESTDSFTTDGENYTVYNQDAEDEALIVFTSGTTGNPKGVVLSQQNLLEDARAISDWHQITRDTRMMCVLPIHHVNGTVVTLVTPFFVGGSIVLNQKFAVKRFFSTVVQEKVHIVSVVPTLLQYLSSYHEESGHPETSPLSHIICGAGPLTVNVAETFESLFDIPIIHGYGLSETTCYSCYLPLHQSKEEHRKWISDYGYPSIGIPVPANEMEIHDALGNALPEGERGEIVIRGVNVMKGYYNNVEANESAFTYGWFRSGDEGFYISDEANRPYFFITGRLKELIIRGAVNLAPLEIDEIINKAPGVKAGIAVGFENDWYGEEVGAYVQLEEGVEENEQAILDYCLENLPFSKSPKVVVFGNDIPVTSTGKYQRRKVIHLFEEWKTVQFKKSRG